MNVNAPKAKCPKCSQLIAVTRDGVFRRHETSRTSVQVCKGSYKKAK